MPIQTHRDVSRPPRRARRRRWSAALVASALTLGGCSFLADLDGYELADGGAPANPPPAPPPTDIAITAGGGDFEGTHYRLSIRAGAPQPIQELRGEHYRLVVGPGAHP